MIRRGLKVIAVLVTVAAITAGTFAAGYAVTWHIMSMAPQENRTRTLDTVRAVCDLAFDNQSDAQFATCYAAQSASDTEYICAANAASHLNCNIEDKQGEK